MSCSWWLIPIQSGPLLETNCPHPYFPNPLLTPTHPLGPVLYMYNDDVNNPSILDPEQDDQDDLDIQDSPRGQEAHDYQEAP